jgi:hypothetical protein
MEGLAHLVAESLVRHGFEATFDHRSLQWSQWFRCQDRFSLLLAPCKPGLFALGEEVIAPGELAVGEGKRMLALFHISEAHDLGMAMGRVFLSHNPEHERLINGRCFARYVVIEDPTQRRSAYDALQRWMASSAEASTGVAQKPRFISRLESQESGSAGHDSQEAGFVSGHDFSRAANPAILSSASAAACVDSTDASEQPESSNKQAQIGPPLPIPSGF